MTTRSQDVLISINAQYNIAPAATPQDLIDDASVWLDYAHGIVHTLAEAISYADEISPTHLSSALFGAAALIQMGRSCNSHAYERMLDER